MPLVKKFFEHDPAAAARSFEVMDESEAASVLKALPPSLAASAFRHLHPSQATAFLRQLSAEEFQGIVSRLDPQQGASIYNLLSEDERRQLVEHLPARARERILELLGYPEGSAGSIMASDHFALHAGTKVKEATRRLRSLARKKRPPSYVYVLDSEGHLLGVANMRDLLIAPGEETLENIMHTDVFKVDPFMDREEVAGELAKRRYFAAPVVDAENRMLGVVRSNQLLSDFQEEATEDLQKMFGAGANERAFSAMGFSLRKRLPWLNVNLATAFLAAGVVALFEDLIAELSILAVFLPVVAGQGGNAGAQSLAVVMRGLVMREIPRQRVWRLIFKECLLGALSGVATGAVTAAVAWLWYGNSYLGVVIGLAMVVNLLAAGLSGAAIPITMKALRLDPAQSSSIILTTVTDVVGFFAFLGFALVFKAHLLPGA